jgi:two-component system KDP operon response regulator KdpE
MTATRLLIVDDELAIRQVVRATLQPLGFEVTGCSRGEEALTLIQSSQVDVILLDINMPGMGGVATCRALRRISANVPILMLSVRDDEDGKVEALDAGADDFVTKPFAVRELVARINAGLRRGQPAAQSGTMISIGDMSLCTERRLFFKRGVQIPLTRTQFNILHLLMSHQGRPVAHKKILSTVWGVEFRDHVEYLRTYVRQLRQRIEDDPAHPQYLLTSPYVGYLFRE